MITVAVTVIKLFIFCYFSNFASFLQGDSKRKESSNKTESSERRKREDLGRKEKDKEREKERSYDQLKVKVEHKERL